MRCLRSILLKILIRVIFKNTKFSVISQNCLGARFYQFLNRTYDTPTIGLWFEANDFLKFSEDIYKYTNTEVKFNEKLSNELGYPVGKIDDIVVYFQHYKTFEEAIKKWEYRCKRIDYSRMLFLMTDRDGFCARCEDKFQNVIGERGLLITCKNRVVQNQVVLKKYEMLGHVGDLYGHYWELVHIDFILLLIKLVRRFPLQINHLK